MDEQPASPHLVAAAQRLAVDLVTVEVVGALRAAGVRPIVLKGPAVALWLYGRRPTRAYGDTDLLVSVDQVGAAERVLGGLGFAKKLDDGDTPGRSTGANYWRRRADRAELDLHWMLPGAKAAPPRVWELLSAEPDVVTIGDTDLEILSIPARTAHIALHAAQHGASFDSSQTDLQQALSRLDDGLWSQAASLARELDALDAFATGLRTLGPGRELATRLGLDAHRSVEATLTAQNAPPAAIGWHDLHRAPPRQRARIAAHKLFPSQRFMRQWSPMANRGPLGLAAAYAWRPFWLLMRAVPGFRAWRRAARESR